MPRQKTGGRQKGTVNKVTKMQREIIASLLDTYASEGLMCKDFMALEPRDRLMIAEKLMQYTMPKYQSITLESTEVKINHTIEERLLQLSAPPKK